MGSNFFPRKDADVANWSRIFLTQLQIGGGFGIPQEQIDSYAQLNAEFQAKYVEAINPQTRTRGMVAEKNRVLRELEIQARRLARIARSAPGMTDRWLIALGLNVPKPASRSHAPTHAPSVSIYDVIGQTVTIWLRDTEGDAIRKPRGVAGAAMYWCVSENEPAGEPFTFGGNSTRAVAKIEFPSDLRAGTRVWITAQWYGRRGQPGPMSRAVSAMLLGEFKPARGRFLRAA